MSLSLEERDRRWSQARQLMVDQELDAILAFGDPGDVPAHQRFLSGYRSMYGDALVLLFTEGDAELVVAMPVVAAYAQQISWISKPRVTAADSTPGIELAKICAERGVRRLGVADLARLPSGWRDDLLGSCTEIMLVDVENELRSARLVKSDSEIENVRRSCAIASEAWSHVADILRVGRREYEVLADIEHILRSHGCEDSYNLVIGVPRLKYPVEALPSQRAIVAGDQLSIEISPRYNGYYSQLTALACLGTVDSETRRAYEAADRARQAGLDVMRAGVDLRDITKIVEAQLNSEGYALTTQMIGHFCGLELDDLRAGATSFELKAGMTFIFHPLVAGYPGMLRADTFLIGETGVEQLTTLPFEPLELS